MSEKHQPDKESCNRLAQMIARRDGLDLVRLLEKSGMLRQAEAREKGPREVPRTPRPISIWQPKDRAGETVFVRPEQGPLGDHYADQIEIHAKKQTEKRVCWFGESAAAGYLYAPHLTPAKILAAYLEHASGPARFEIVDLARTNETLPSLIDTVAASLQLKPDLIVIYAGNNWNLLETPDASPYVPDYKARQQYGQCLRSGGFTRSVERAASRMMMKAGRALAEIDRIVRSSSIPVILVVPEVNLADWASRQPVVWLPGDRVEHWYDLYHLAQTCLENGRWGTATELAWQMLELDEGLNPVGYRILAEAKRGLSKEAEALLAYRAEIDAASLATICFLDTPRTTSPAAEIQRRAARQYGFHHVDLPAIFSEIEPVPGRRLFADYCHLTVEGMKSAMSAVAEKILEIEGGDLPDEPWPDPEIEAEAEATALFGAAIHTAHRLPTGEPKTEILQYWCEAALSKSAGIAETMIDLVEARLAPCPEVLTAAQQRNLHSSYRLMLQHGWKYDYFDADLILAIRSVLSKKEPKHAERIDRILIDGQGLTPEDRELLPFCIWDPLEQCFPEVMRYDDLTPRAYYRAHWPLTSFCLVWAGTGDVVLDFVVRRPEHQDSKIKTDVQFRINGKSAEMVAVGKTWTKVSIHLAEKDLIIGLNRLSLTWPSPTRDGYVAVAETIRALENGVESPIHPIFGEIFSVKARIATAPRE